MNDTLYIAATGMQAQHSQLTVIANNVANVNTPGFKRSSVAFGDLVRQAGEAAAATSDVAQAKASFAGAGVGVTTTAMQFTPGELKASSQPMALAIQGAGFLEVMLPDGSNAYVRSAVLQVNSDGYLTTQDGHVLSQKIRVDRDQTDIGISQQGEVVGRDRTGREWRLGRLDLAMFANPAALQPIGQNLYRSSAQAGDAVLVTPGDAGAGPVMQGYEEQSNVKLVEEMLQLMVAQRAYEMNVKVIQAADEIAGMTNNLRKS
jgi:flagellar basal-body rod protein FlgG